MARSSDINQRIVLSGADEVRRHLEEIGKAGERAGSTTRSALLAATSGASNFTAGARTAAASSGQMRFALQNLSFQVNDVATSLASGGDVMRVFAQQGGQIFQVFQQGGGASAVLGGAATAIRSMITPMTAAAAAAVGLAAGLALVLSRATSQEAATRKFDVVLKGLGKTGQATGAQLTKAAANLKDVGLSFSEGQAAIEKGIQQGIDPRQIEKVVRAGQNLNTVLGEGSAEKFADAVAKGGPPLREFAVRLGIIPKSADDASKALAAAAATAARSTQAINAAIVSRNRSIADEERTRNQAIVDLTRQRGTAEEEIQLASNRRIEEINRQHTIALNELFAQRNADNAKAIAENNERILAAAQLAAESSQGVLDQIAAKAEGARRAAMSPLQLAIDDMRIAWNELSNTVANSWFIKFMVQQLTEILTVTRLLITELGKIGSGPSLPTLLAGGGGAPGMAEGGMVRGPGTGTSDSIMARLSNGEFVMNALATRMNLPILQAMNALNRPIIPQFRMPRGFAAGGLVSSGGGSRTPINLNIGGETFALEGDAATAQRVIRFSRKKAMLSAGRIPSTA